MPGAKKLLLLLTGFAALTSLAVLGMAWALSSVITNLWLGGALPDQYSWVALFALCFIGIQAIAWLQDSILDRFAHRQVDRLRQELISAIFTRGPELVQAHGTGNTTTMLLEGIEQVETYLRIILPKMVRILVVPLLLLVPVFMLDWVSGVVMVIVFPFIVLYMVILGKAAQEKAAKQHRRFQILSNHIIDSLRGIDTLKLFGASEQHGKNIYAVSEEFRKATIRTLRAATLSNVALDLFATLSVAAVAILLGLRLLDGSLVLFPALTILVLAPEYFKPIREFASDFHASLDGRNALASIQEAIRSAEGGQPADAEGTRVAVDTQAAEEKQTFEGTRAVEEAGRDARGLEGRRPSHSAAVEKSRQSQPVAVEGTQAVEEERGAGTFKTRCSNQVPAPRHLPVLGGPTHLVASDLSFSYDGFRALEDLSFDVTGFAKVGIVGMSGAGKSTLIQLLGGFIAPEKGTIAVDGIAVTGPNRSEWQRHVAYLPQDPYIFHATLRENIAFYRPEATEEEVAQAVEVVGLQGLIDELPQGLSTRIGEGARALSGGQAQRVALARVCLDAKRSILLFDEPTAHLDIETELELKQRMLQLMHGRMVFFATHRLHWMNDMDSITVLDKGKVVEQGTLEELLGHRGSFTSLVSQMEGGAA